MGKILDPGVALYQGYGQIDYSTYTYLEVRVSNASGTYVGATGVSSTVPMTWASGDIFGFYGTYEAA